MRDRLIELMRNAPRTDTVYGNIKLDEPVQTLQTIADHLLANGVIVPPCKVGDTVYKVIRDKRVKQPYECKVVGFWYSADERCNNVHLVRYVHDVFDSSFSIPFTEIGKTVFLTKEEAERALAERSKE